MNVSSVKAARPKAGLTAEDKKGNQILEKAVASAPLAEGGKSRAVSYLKRLLRIGGYSLDSTDVFNAETRKAVEGFQRAAALPIDGQVNKATLIKMEKLLLHMRTNGDKFAGIGQKSSVIAAAERRLDLLGYTPGDADGIFDTTTAKAVVEYRKDEGGSVATNPPRLTPGLRTLLKSAEAGLNHIPWKDRVTKTDALVRLDRVTADAVAAGPIRQGATGEAVKTIQAHLKAAGFDPKHVDGKFDERTRGMVEAFQRQSDLPVTGVVDDATWKKLDPSQILSTGTFSPPQSLGEKETAIKNTQEQLRLLGFSKVPVNGIYDAATEAAVKAFEADQGLPVDGEVSKSNFDAMQAAIAKKYDLKTRAGCAAYILASSRVSFWQDLSTGPDRKQFVRLAAGQKAKVEVHGTFVWPKLKMLQALVEMTKHGPIMINALTGGRHSDNSNHYKGLAVDMDLDTNNAAMIERIARKFGGRRNNEKTHIHLDFTTRRVKEREEIRGRIPAA